jgi:hypothetical protein
MIAVPTAFAVRLACFGSIAAACLLLPGCATLLVPDDWANIRTDVNNSVHHHLLRHVLPRPAQIQLAGNVSSRTVAVE